MLDIPEMPPSARRVTHQALNKVQYMLTEAVAKRRKTRPQDGNWGSDGAIDQSSGVIELAEAIGESISSSSREAHLPETHDTSNPAVEFSSVVSDEEEGNTNNEEFENISDRVDSASNVSENANLAEIARLREDFTELLREVKELRESYKEGIRQVNANLIKQHDYFVEAIEQSDLRMRQIDDRVDDKLDKFHYSSDERIKEIEERLDDYKYKMTRFEELQEQRRMENPLTGNDIASRGRDVMSSVISLGLATVSLLLFVFTTAVDFLKVFSENNLLSTGLSLGLFAAIIFTYHYFDADRTS